jgi:hypothetical protein
MFKGIAYVLLLIFGAYIALRYYSLQIGISKRQQNNSIAPPGVNFYCSRPVTQRPQQIWAFSTNNCCQTTQCGYSPAFGPIENQNRPLINLEI